jgi:hypothetical protein
MIFIYLFDVIHQNFLYTSFQMNVEIVKELRDEQN